MKFLGRAKRFFKELASEPTGKVQYFNVTCGSGHRVRGERTEGYQALRCPACGDGVFVLPRSPLPEPPGPTRTSRSGGARRARGPSDDGPVELTDPGRAALDLADTEAGAADAEIIWDDAAESADQPRRESAGNPGRDRAGAQPASARAGQGDEPDDFWEDDLNRASAAPPRESSEGRQKRPVADRGSGAEPGKNKQKQPAKVRGARPSKQRKLAEAPAIEIQPARKRPGPLALVLILVPALVVTAVVWRIRQSVRQEYPLMAEKGRLEGVPALNEGNFDKAFQLLSAAKIAVDGLGGKVKGAEEIEIAAREAEIFVNLCPQLLEEMLDEAGRTDKDTWASKFNALYKGRTIVIDSIITDVPVAGTSSRYRLDVVILPPGGTSNFANARDARPDRFGLIDLEGFELLEQPARSKGDHVTFGARLASFEKDEDGDVWWVRLEPKSGVYIVHSQALQALGFPGLGPAVPAPEALP